MTRLVRRFAEASLIFVALVLSTAASAKTLEQLASTETEPDSPLEKLANKLPGSGLSPTESRLLQMIEKGAYDWTPDDERLPEPTKQHRVRAELIRWLLVDEKPRPFVTSIGKIQILGAWIPGKIDLSYMTVNVPLILSSCRIPKGITLLSADIADLELIGSVIGDEHAMLAEEDLAILDAVGLKVRGNVLLSNGFHSFGKVDLYGAKIKGQLYCSGGHFSNPGGTFSRHGHETLRLSLAKIDSEAMLNEGFESDGTIDLEGTKIDGNLIMDGARFTAASPSGLRASGVIVEGAFDWTNIGRSPTGSIEPDLSNSQVELDLSNSRVGVLMDDKASWPSHGHLFIDGFVYQRIDSEHADDASDREEWLERQPPPLKPQPYRQLAKVFLDNGQDEQARDILVDKEREMRKQAVFPERFWQERLFGIRDLFIAFVRYLTLGTLGLTIDYGYQPLRALFWIAAFVLIGTGLFRWGYTAGVLVPTDHGAYEVFKKTHRVPPDYQTFNSFVYALETFVPLIELHQASYWLPIPQSEHTKVPYAGRLLRWYLWLHIILGWVFTSMLVAGVAGLIKNA